MKGKLAYIQNNRKQKNFTQIAKCVDIKGIMALLCISTILTKMKFVDTIAFVVGGEPAELISLYALFEDYQCMVRLVCWQ